MCIRDSNKEKLVWLHREAEEYLDAYLAVSGIEEKLSLIHI